MTALDTKYKLFLQGIMCRKILNAPEVKQLLRKCCDDAGEAAPQNMGEIVDFIGTVNQAIVQFDMKISKGVGELDGKPYYALLNTKESAICRMSVNYSKKEMDFFLKLVDLIIESAVGQVSSVNALNLTDKLDKTMSKMEAQELLGRLQEEHWITQIRGKISLDTLAIMELDQYIREEFDGINICTLCRLVVLQGPECPSCEKKFHQHCVDRVFHNIQHRSCPSCRKDWDAGTTAPTVSSSGTSQKRQKSR